MTEGQLCVILQVSIASRLSLRHDFYYITMHMTLSRNRVAQLFGILAALIVLGLFVLISRSMATDYSHLVKEPNGGDILYKGNTYTIVWDNMLLAPRTQMEIWLGKSDHTGTTYVSKIADVTNSDHSYSWTVSTGIADGATYTISVRAKNVMGAADSSDFDFAILEKKSPIPFEFLTPAQGEFLGDGSSRIISWRSPIVSSANLRILKGSGIIYDNLLVGDSLFNRSNPISSERNDTEMAFHFAWPVHNTGSGTYTIQIISNQTTISREVTIAQPTIIIEAPKGQEKWTVNETRNISWQSSNVTTLDIELLLDGQRTLSIARVNANQRAYAWKIPTNLPSDDGYTIQIRDIATGQTSTSGRFQIINDAKPSRDTLLKTGIDPKVWTIERSRRHWIPSIPVFNAYGYDWNAVRIVDKGELLYYPRAKVLRAQGDYKVYYITESGMKRHIPNPEVFLSYGNRWDDIITIIPLELGAYPDSVMIRAQGDSKVYLLENGKKRWITSVAAFNRHHFDWSRIAPVNRTELSAYPTGSNVN